MSKNKSVPPITLGLPVYNGENYLERAVDSILGQTFGDFRLLISDNASTDATADIGQYYAARDKRVLYLRNPRNIGANANFYRLLEYAVSPFFKWCAHDDELEHNYLEATYGLLKSDPDAMLAHSRVTLIDNQSLSLRTPPPGVPAGYDPERDLDHPDPWVRLSAILLQTRWCYEIFGLFRRQMLASTPLYRGRYYGVDKVMLAYLILHGPFLTAPEPLFRRRCHTEQSTAIPSAKARQAWSGTTGKQARFAFPRLQCFAGYSTAVLTAGLPFSAKILCALPLLRYATQFAKWNSFARQMLGRRPHLYPSPAPSCLPPSSPLT